MKNDRYRIIFYFAMLVAAASLLLGCTDLGTQHQPDHDTTKVIGYVEDWDAIEQDAVEIIVTSANKFGVDDTLLVNGSQLRRMYVPEPRVRFGLLLRGESVVMTLQRTDELEHVKVPVNRYTLRELDYPFAITDSEPPLSYYLIAIDRQKEPRIAIGETFGATSKLINGITYITSLDR